MSDRKKQYKAGRAGRAGLDYLSKSLPRDIDKVLNGFVYEWVEDSDG